MGQEGVRARRSSRRRSGDGAAGRVDGAPRDRCRAGRRASRRVALHRRRRRPTPATRRSIRSTRRTSRSSRWRGPGVATTSGPNVDSIFRSTPLYVDGLLYTVAGERRTVAAIDPATGETIWTYREPHTTRFARGMRNNYGKGVAFAEVDGRKVIFYTSPGVLPARARREVRRTPGELGHRRAAARVPEVGRRGHAARPREGLGSVAQLGLQVRPGSRDPSRSRQPLHLVAADRRQRRDRGRQRPRAGVLPDAHREHPGRHPRLRCQDRQAAVEVPRHSAAGRVRSRHLEERRVEAHGRRVVVGADVGRSRSAGSSTSRPTRRPSTSSAASAPATTCSAPACSRSTSRPAGASGTSRWCITTSGTSTTPRRRSCWTSPIDGRRTPIVVRDDQAGLRLRVQPR